MRRRQKRQTLLSQAMRLKRSGGREDMADLAHIRDELDHRRSHLFLRCLIIATALVVIACAFLLALILPARNGSL